VSLLLLLESDDAPQPVTASATTRTAQRLTASDRREKMPDLMFKKGGNTLFSSLNFFPDHNLLRDCISFNAIEVSA
jgi:hypothetical protein